MIVCSKWGGGGGRAQKPQALSTKEERRRLYLHRECFKE